jgi:hypothetical protein
MASLLLSPPSILSEMNSNLWILWDSVFQLNSDFISNLNLNPLRLLPHPYISLGAPPPRISMPIPPHNRSKRPNHRKKNHVKIRSVAFAIYRWSPAIVSRRAATFPVNLKSIWRYRWVPLAVPSLPDFTDLKSKVYSLSYSKFRWTSGEVPMSRLHCCLLPWAPSKFYK